jgi:thiol-disulfide isomerase/thioredoxin
MKKILFSAAVFVLFFSIGNIGAGGQKAPGIALEDIDGQFTMLTSLLAKSNVIISFWSYDCVPCRKEMPELNQLAQSDLFKQKNVKVVFVYVEATTEKSSKDSEGKAPKDKAVEVLNLLKVKELCLLDIYGVAFNNYRKATNVDKATMPLIYLLNQKQEIVFKAIGYNEENLKKLEKAIENKL